MTLSSSLPFAKY